MIRHKGVTNEIFFADFYMERDVYELRSLYSVLI